MSVAPRSWVIRPLTPEEVYTDRERPLAFFYKISLQAIGRRTRSTVLLGKRRMGKTEIFKRVVNRLFFEQEQYTDPSASVVPVFYSFSDRPTDEWSFALNYTVNFMRWYAAFRLRNPNVLDDEQVPAEHLGAFIRANLKETGHFIHSSTLYESLLRKGVNDPVRAALMLVRNTSDHDESTIAVFLDEFQNTRLPQYNFDIVGAFHETVESPTCPYFVTGSAMSILAQEILGRGALFGRFFSEPIKPLTQYWGAELALKAAAYYHAGLPEAMAPVVADRCGGNPFYVTAVIQQAALRGKPLADETLLNAILAVDLSSGFIWGELNDQVSRWIARINEYGITKLVLYLSALEEGEQIEPKRIQEELRARDGRDVSLETIRDTLIKLARGDLLEYSQLGNWFRKTEDPILLDFLRVWGRIVVEGEARDLVQTEVVRKYRALERRVADQLGYLAEVYMAQMLWNGQDRTLPGRWFHSAEDVVIPWRFIYIWHRTRLGAGAGMELDIEAAAGEAHWIGESKWRRERKADRAEVETLLRKAERVREKEGPLLPALRVWFFSYAGFTAEAEALMQEHGIFWSTADDLNALLIHVGLRRLPEL